MDINNLEEFKRLHQCNFQPERKYKELDEALTRYYRESDKLDNRQARLMYREFKLWCDCCGYTAKEINQAKQRCNQFL